MEQVPTWSFVRLCNVGHVCGVARVCDREKAGEQLRTTLAPGRDVVATHVRFISGYTIVLDAGPKYECPQFVRVSIAPS